MPWAFLAHYFRRTTCGSFLLVRSRKEHRGVDLISEALPFGRPWYGEPNAISNAIDYASHDAGIRFYDHAGNVIETHEHAGDFKARSGSFRGSGWLPTAGTSTPAISKSHKADLSPNLTLARR
jgi:hypothetical protein